METKKEEKQPKSLEIVTHKLPKNEEELYQYIETNTKGVIPPTPRWSVQEGHSSPLDFISESYFEEVTDCIVLANRHGVKTMSFSILAFLDLTHKNLGIATIGAIQPQARRSYEYTQKFCRLFPNYIEKSLMSTTTTKGGGNLEIVVGSIRGVNCLTGDTTIETLDEKRKIRELVGKKGFYLHSFDLKSKRFTISKVKRVWKAGKALVYKVIFDKGVLFATRDHLVLLKDGNYRAVGDLKVGDRVEVLYRTIERDKRERSKYYWNLKVAAKEHKREHRWVMEEFLGRKLQEGEVVHHKVNTLNNNPDCLEIMSREEHSSQTNIGNKNFWFGKKRPEQSKKLKQYLRDLSPEEMEKRIAPMRDSYKNMSPSEKKKFAEESRKRVLQDWKTEDRRQKQTENWKNQFTSAKEQGMNNHTVISVKIYGEEDVYDIETEKNQNFVANGIVVHNSLTQRRLTLTK